MGLFTFYDLNRYVWSSTYVGKQCMFALNRTVIHVVKLLEQRFPYRKEDHLG